MNTHTRGCAMFTITSHCTEVGSAHGLRVTWFQSWDDPSGFASQALLLLPHVRDAHALADSSHRLPAPCQWAKLEVRVRECQGHPSTHWLL